MIVLYHNDMSLTSQKVRFVLSEKGIDWQSREIDLQNREQTTPGFLNVNPRGMVPVLVHDSEVVIESNIIAQYLDDLFPAPALMPESALERARVRLWLQMLDTERHDHITVLTYSIVFRHIIMKRIPDAEERRTFYQDIPNYDRRILLSEIIEKGVESPRFEMSMAAYRGVITEINEALKSGGWLVGDRLSLADIGYAPYITRLDQLGLQGLWEDMPRVVDWYERLREGTGYQKGIAAWFSPLLTDMKAHARAMESKTLPVVSTVTLSRSNEY